jgi:hypothetical protein
MSDLQRVRVQEGATIKCPMPFSRQEGPFTLKPGETHAFIWIAERGDDGLVQALTSDTEIRTTVSKMTNGNWTILVENFSMFGRIITFNVIISYFP